MTPLHILNHSHFRFHPRPTSNDYNSCLRDTPVETTTNSGYYEEIQTTDTRVETVTGNGNDSTMRDLFSGKQGAEYESVDDMMPRGRQITYTDGTTYDDVVDGTPMMPSYEKVHEPVILMTPDAETIIIDNCIYGGVAQEWHYRHCTLPRSMHTRIRSYDVLPLKCGKIVFSKHTEPVTKLPPVCRRHFKLMFVNQNWCILIQL